MPNTPLLINVVSKRVRQLIQGNRPLTKPDNVHMSNMDLALKEIAEGKLSAEIAFVPTNKGPDESSLISL